MSTIHAIFEDGVFRPSEPVELPNGAQVEFEPRIVGGNNGDGDHLSRVYDVLGKRFDSGESDVADRHNEHQP